MSVSLSITQKSVLLRLLDEDRITFTRWVRGSRSGGDPARLTFKSLAARRLIRVVKIEERKEDRTLWITHTYPLTAKGKAKAEKIKASRG